MKINILDRKLFKVESFQALMVSNLADFDMISMRCLEA